MLAVFFDVAELWTVQLDVEIMALAMYVAHRESPEVQDDSFETKNVTWNSLGWFFRMGKKPTRV